MFNKVILIGRIGMNPELKTGKSGNSFCNFTVATNDGYGENKRTNWHNVTAFGKTAENVYKFCHKGSLVEVDGSIDYQEYEKNSEKRIYTKILADNVLFLSPKSEQSVQSTTQSTVVDQTYKAPSNNDSFGGGDVIPDESIPF